MTGEISTILQMYRTVAIVGLSRDPEKDSFRVATYLKANGYHIIPINPFADEILGEKCYRSLLDVPESIQKTIEIVDIFRPSEDVPTIVDQAIQLKKKFGKPEVIWMQLGIINEKAAEQALNAGLIVVMDKCMMIEHRKLSNVKIENEIVCRIKMEKMREMMKKVSGRSADEQRKTIDKPILVTDENFNQVIQLYPLMIIDCWAPWCGPCRMISPVLDEMAKDYAGKVVFGKLNVDENPRTAMQFGIMAIPTLLIVKNGNVVDRIVGAVPRETIESKMQAYL
jgi:thioredoxin 1